MRPIPLWMTAVLLFANACSDSSAPAPAASTPAATETSVPAEEPAAPPADPDAVGAVSGVIRFEGSPPERMKIPMGSDLACARAHTVDVLTEEVLVTDGKLQNVLVHLKSGVSGKFSAPPDALTLDQNGCVYTPHVIAIMTKQPLKIRNSDPTAHNINCISKAGQGFNISQNRQGLEETRTFNLPEIGARVKCDVHPWMGAWLHVLKHPFFSVTGADGAFTLKGIPAGKYTLAAWHEKYGEKTAEVTVEKDGTATADFVFSAK